MKSTAFVLGCASLALAACSGYKPLVDAQGVDPIAYEKDLGECQAYAKQVGVGGEVAGGTVIGAAAGAVLGRVIGGSDDLAYGARIGAAHGAIAGTGRAVGGQRDVIRNCLRGRGYRVLR